MEGALHQMAIDESVTESGIAMAAYVVDGVDAIDELEHSDVMALGGDSYASTFKQIGLGGHVGPRAHGQMG
jgi:hypothetical protein